MMGRIEEAREHLDRALAIHSEAGSIIHRARDLRELASFERQVNGNLDAADQMAHEAERLLRNGNDVLERARLLCELGHLALARGGTGGMSWARRRSWRGEPGASPIANSAG